ncbi:MAG: hypothetical protein K2X27_19930, partial [Candidatus Obscuribacterales bacterium]|nr:hypothetical protein [Candidatus Obscuribacterales bacterium]
ALSVNPLELPWTVGFEFLPQGIKVNGIWYPVLSMDWVEGTPLNLHVASLCQAGDKDALNKLRLAFSEMVAGLRDAYVAHGDLQHGNILVRDNRIVLVDYDGMFVPGLSKKHSNELGHPNYQHPGRSEENFDDTLDHFSSWIIDTALLCLREDPALWRFSYDDGESLLFHRQDFIQPQNSPVLKALAMHQSTQVRERAKLLSEFLTLEIAQIPPLYSELISAKRRSLEPMSELSRLNEISESSSSSKSGLPDWIADADLGS